MKIKNIAIIAHVDHGKTTLVDQLLKTAGLFRQNEVSPHRLMDFDQLEMERGITILAKTTSIHYQDYKINILDTPGHSDFFGEVERIMNMVDGCLLLVDAFEGTMPQTKFVLKKALENKVKPIVVINKVDRPNINPQAIVDEVLELFLELGAPDEFLDFKVVYTSALKGTSSLSPFPSEQKEGMGSVLDLIIQEIPDPKVNPDGHLQWQPSLFDFNDFVGRIGIGLVKSGSVFLNQNVTALRLDGTVKSFRIQKIYSFSGVNRFELNEAHAGDIVGIAGLADLGIGETICEVDFPLPLPPIKVGIPTLQMTFSTNNGPLAGQEGKFVTFRHLLARLEKEMQKDVSLKIERLPNQENVIVSGRGELHLSILLENMRREGYELLVSKPRVIYQEIDGKLYEPFEEMVIDLPNDFVGGVMNFVGDRKGKMLDMLQNETSTRLIYEIPTRGLLDFATPFMSLTKGYGTMTHIFKDYYPASSSDIGQRIIGVLVATDTGTATNYALQQLEERGVMFIKPGTSVYEGMIVGENRYDHDLAVNVIREKAMTNVRSSTKEQTVVLKVPRAMSLEACLDYINDDEQIEITPLTFRMRKKILKTEERKKSQSHRDR